MMKETLPPGYEDPYVDYRGWHSSRFGSLPTPEDNQRWKNLLKEWGFNDQIIERRRSQIIMKATVELVMDYANRLMSDTSDVDPNEGFTPIY